MQRNKAPHDIALYDYCVSIYEQTPAINAFATFNIVHAGVPYWRHAVINMGAIFYHPAYFCLFSSIIMDTLRPELIKIYACQYHNESVKIVCATSEEN